MLALPILSGSIYASTSYQGVYMLALPILSGSIYASTSYVIREYIC